MSNYLQPPGLQYTSSSILHYLPVCSNSYPLSRLAISSSADSFSFSLQSFPASADSFPMSQLFTSGGQIIGASASVLSMNIQGWFPLRLTGLIFLWSMGFSRIFCSTTVWNYQLFITRPSGLCKIQVMVADPVIISSALILVLFIYLNHYSGTEIDCVPSIASDPSL